MNFCEHARVRSCYYEWQFWEMSWTYQDWVQEVTKHESPVYL